jgi:hypothetical protein
MRPIMQCESGWGNTNNVHSRTLFVACCSAEQMLYMVAFFGQFAIAVFHVLTA